MENIYQHVIWFKEKEKLFQLKERLLENGFKDIELKVSLKDLRGDFILLVTATKLAFENSVRPILPDSAFVVTAELVKGFD
jgi:hypothetical protein